MATFKPEVNYDNLIKHETSCGNQTCKVQLDSTNYGEKIDESSEKLEARRTSFEQQQLN